VCNIFFLFLFLDF